MTLQTNRRQQQGLSLIEMMIALAISSMVTVGLVQMFSANQDTSRLLRGQATLAESGRFAMEMMGRSIRKAGYRGCNSKRAVEGTINSVPYEFALANGLQGYDAAGASWAPNFTITQLPTTSGATDTNIFSPNGESSTGVDLTSLRQGTDFLTVWFASSTEYSVDTATQPITSGTEAILLNASIADIASDMARYHVVFINDCSTENMIVVTQINNSGGQAELEHAAGVGVGGVQNLTPIMGSGSGYQNGAIVTSIVSHTFYVGESENVNEFGDTIYSLFRKEGVNAPVELVEGIENLQILYGVDTQGEVLVPSIYLPSSGVSDFRDVVSVRIQVTANSIEDVSSTNVDSISSAADGLSRRTFTQTIRLRNRLKKE